MKLCGRCMPASRPYVAIKLLFFSTCSLCRSLDVMRKLTAILIILAVCAQAGCATIATLNEPETKNKVILGLFGILSWPVVMGSA